MLFLVEKVRNQWDSTQHGVELRQQQLEDMVIDSLQWEDHKEETEELMRKYEAQLYILQQARRDPLIKQISDNQVRLVRYLLAILICCMCGSFGSVILRVLVTFSQVLRIHIEINIKHLTKNNSERFLEA